MPNPQEEFRQQLLDLESLSPILRQSYQTELDALLHPPLTRQAGILGSILAIALLITTALIARADLYYHVHGLMLVAHVSLAAAFLVSSLLIFRDLRKRKQSHPSASLVSGILTWAAGIITVVALIIGLGHASDPKSLYGAFYVFVFYFACVAWSLDNRIKSAELSAREQSLRIECRLADIASRLQK